MEDRKIKRHEVKRGGLAHPPCLLLSLFLIFCPTFFCHTASSRCVAAESPVESLPHADIGFAGKYKSGFWTPVTVTLLLGPDESTGELQLLAADGDNVPVVFFRSQES